MFPCSRETKSAGRADRLTPKPTPFKGGREVRAYAVQSNGSDHDPHHGNNHGEDRKNHGNKRKHHDAGNHRSAEGRQRLTNQSLSALLSYHRRQVKVNGTKENRRRKKIEDGYKNAVERYQSRNVQRVVMNLNKRTDADILARLEKAESKQGYIKKAIRAYMEQE